ncbi:unnamed protein product [Somion occarium]|uniref:BTB domain-containing protein n=1 Tax=Somion occarium TaxID=3059160 RepID=A0ABP1D834_9APHY
MSLTLEVASAPFDNTKANVILRSCDNTDFYVYKEVLILASSFFEDMFSLHQPQDDIITIQTITTDSHPIIPVQEDKETLDYLLRLCYPILPPQPLTDLSFVSKVLRAALKYDVNKVVSLMKADLRSLGVQDPPCMFAIACQLRLEEEAIFSARTWREEVTDLDYGSLVAKSYRDEMNEISAGAFCRFLKFVRSSADSGPLCDPPTLTSSLAETDDRESNFDLTVGSNNTTEPFDLGEIYHLVPDVVLRSSDSIDIRCHKAILKLASPDNEILRRCSGDVEGAFQDGMPVVELDENGIILIKLLRLCYPFGEARFRNRIDAMESADGTTPFQTDLKVFDSAAKYQFEEDVLAAARMKWMNHVHLEPLRIFFLAVFLGRTAEAQLAAKELVIQHKPLESLDVENAEWCGSARYYRQLITYLRQYSGTGQGNDMENATAFATASVPAPLVLDALGKLHAKMRLNSKSQTAKAMASNEAVWELVREGQRSGIEGAVIPPIELDPLST